MIKSKYIIIIALCIAIIILGWVLITPYFKPKQVKPSQQVSQQAGPKTTIKIQAHIYWPPNHIFPTFASTKELYVVDLRGKDFYTYHKHLVLTTLQGLVNREKPRIYIIFTDRDYKWLELCSKELGIKVTPITVDEVIKKFAKYATGYIVYDPKVPDTVNLATTMAGIYNCVVVHPDDIPWIKKFGLKEFYDFRGKFKDRLEAYLWAYKNLWPKCCHRLLATVSPGPPICTHNPMQVAGRDYVVALRLFAQYLDLQNASQYNLFIKLLRDMPNNTAVLGWFEEEEWNYVHTCSLYGKFVVVMFHHYGPLGFANPTVWGGLVPKEQLKFKLPPIDIRKLGYEDKIYITFYITDGDNLQWDYDMLRLWNDPNRGKIPIAWTISPYLIDVAPFMMYYYSKTATANDTFISGPSGAGYWYPAANHHYILQYLKVTKYYFNRTGLKFVEILGYDDYAGELYAKNLNILAIKREYSVQYSLFTLYQECVYYLDDVPTPIVFGYVHYKDSTYDYFKVRVQALKYINRRPLFILVVSQPWDFRNLATVTEVVKELYPDKDIIFVNFHEFITLVNPVYGIKQAKIFLQKAKEKGASKELIQKAEYYINKAEQLCKLRVWWDATLNVNKAFKYLRIALTGS